MNIFLHYVIIDLVFGGTKRAKFASPPLTSPWIYILHCNYLFRIRWHQNLTLCYFLFSIRWHQKGSVCFSPSNITMIIYFIFGGTKILHYVIFYLVFGGTKRAQFASAPSSITMNIFLRYVIFYFVFHNRWHQNLTLCYFLFSIRWHQKDSVCFSPSNITMNIYLTFVIFYFIFGGTKILHYVIFYFLFCNTKWAQFASGPLASPWIYSYVMLFFI